VVGPGNVESVNLPPLLTDASGGADGDGHVEPRASCGSHGQLFLKILYGPIRKWRRLRSVTPPGVRVNETARPISSKVRPTRPGEPARKWSAVLCRHVESDRIRRSGVIPCAVAFRPTDSVRKSSIMRSIAEGLGRAHAGNSRVGFVRLVRPMSSRFHHRITPLLHSGYDREQRAIFPSRTRLRWVSEGLGRRAAALAMSD